MSESEQRIDPVIIIRPIEDCDSDENNEMPSNARDLGLVVSSKLDTIRNESSNALDCSTRPKAHALGRPSNEEGVEEAPISFDDKAQRAYECSAFDQEQVVRLDKRGRRVTQKRLDAIEKVRQKACLKRKEINEKAKLYDEIKSVGASNKINYDELSNLVAEKIIAKKQTKKADEEHLTKPPNEPEKVFAPYRMPKDKFIF